MPDNENNSQDESQQDPTRGMVPSSRLKAESRLKREAQSRAADLLTRVGDLEQKLEAANKKAGTVDSLAAQIESMRAEHEKAVAGWAERESVYQSGITDPDAIDVAKLLHGKLPEEGRPPLGEWLSGLKEDPAKAPKALQPYFSAPSSDGGASGGAGSGAGADGGKAAAPPATGAPAGGKVPPSGQPATGGQYSAESIRDMVARAQQTGDWSEYKAARGAIFAQIRQE